MATLKKYNLQGAEVGSADVADELFEAEASGQMIKDYIVALRENARQWSASTKGRSEVAHSKKKPHPQKKTGNARQGSLASPQYKGGGRVFTPRPKFDQHVKVNKKEKKLAMRAIIGEKLRAGSVTVVDSSEMQAPKTKTLAGFMKARSVEGRTLFIAESSFVEFEDMGASFKVHVHSNKHRNFALSVRNIEKAEFSLASNLSGYDLMVAKNLVVTESALNELISWLNG